MRKTLLLGVCAALALVLHNSSARAVDPEVVKKAVDAGVAYLKAGQNQEGAGAAGVRGGADNNSVGATALVAMTLLECDVKPDDPAIKKATEVIRTAAVTQTATYDIALSILFLDKLRDPVDVALIESLTVRLMAGQNSMGGWGYTCPQISDEEIKRLADLLKNRVELKGARTVPKGDDTKRSPKDLPKEIQAQIQIINRGGVAAAVNDGRFGGGGDNSNTQFATLALWVARRHGLPVDNTLGRVNLRFRKTVNADSGWGYMPDGDNSKASMTCAGLLGLAVAYGVATEIAEDKAKAGDKDKEGKPKEVAVPDISKDPILMRSLGALSTTVGLPSEKLKAAGQPVLIPQIGGESYYFLWSLERVCMALDLDAIGGKDWYAWGAEILIANQQRDGSWQGQYANYQADTCFALLFLKRANFTRDLSAHLKGKLEKREIRGGVGGEGLKAKLAGGLSKPGEAGETSSGLKEPRPAGEAREIDRLAREAVDAKGERQEKLLAEMRDGKGRPYTEALVATVSQLNGEAKKTARKRLAERLAKESADKLTGYLDDKDVEIRRAAALACALAESKVHVPQLIGLLRDREPLVSRAAWAALKNMTGQNFGPSADATDADKDKAVEAWREWWKKNGK